MDLSAWNKLCQLLNRYWVRGEVQICYLGEGSQAFQTKIFYAAIRDVKFVNICCLWVLQKLKQQFKAFVIEESVFRDVYFLKKEEQITIFFQG